MNSKQFMTLSGVTHRQSLNRYIKNGIVSPTKTETGRYIFSQQDLKQLADYRFVSTGGTQPASSKEETENINDIFLRIDALEYAVGLQTQQIEFLQEVFRELLEILKVNKPIHKGQ